MSHSFFFTQECLNPKGISALDKYVIAAHLAEAMEARGYVEVKEIDDVDYAPLLLQSKAHM